jgi:hypothetical protein
MFAVSIGKSPAQQKYTNLLEKSPAPKEPSVLQGNLSRMPPDFLGSLQISG